MHKEGVITAARTLLATKICSTNKKKFNSYFINLFSLQYLGKCVRSFASFDALYILATQGNKGYPCLIIFQLQPSNVYYNKGRPFSFRKSF